MALTTLERPMSDPDQTLTTIQLGNAYASAPILAMTILWHPEQMRIGEQCMCPEGFIELSRFAPLFSHPGQHSAIALGHRAISRAPVRIRLLPSGAIEIAIASGKMAVEVNGIQCQNMLALDAVHLERGIVLGLGGRIFICLHWMRSLPHTVSMAGFLGVSSAAIQIRNAILQVSDTDLPVLLLGETGSGKELVAQAIHRSSMRCKHPFVAVNMATLSDSLAAADLFGTVKGAYTGAQTARRGWFAEANDGTLFLDEVGDTPTSVQAMLLRVLENGHYRPIGAANDAVSQARLIAATDRALDVANFNQALLRRMEAYVIHLPALRERREDIGLLVRHFLQQHAPEQLDAVPPNLLSQIFNGEWPGNVRQLKHAVRRIALDLRAQQKPVLPASTIRPLESRSVEQLTRNESAPATLKSCSKRRKIPPINDQDLQAAMKSCNWRILGAAKQLGISRAALYKRLNDHPEIRFPNRISHEEIRHAWYASGKDLLRCASHLQSPAEALRRQLVAIGLLTSAL